MIVNLLVGKNEEVIDELICLGCIPATENTLEIEIDNMKSNIDNWVEYENILFAFENPTEINFIKTKKMLDENRKMVDTIVFMVETIEEMKLAQKTFDIHRIVFANNSSATYVYDDIPF